MNTVKSIEGPALALVIMIKTCHNTRLQPGQVIAEGMSQESIVSLSSH
jgi:hypothetical protein